MIRAAALLCIFGFTDARAAVRFAVKIDDPGHVFGKDAEPIRTCAQAAADHWTFQLAGKARLDVVIRPAKEAIPAICQTRCLCWAFVAQRGNYNIFESGAAAKINAGVDCNGDDPDIEILVSCDLLRRWVWLNPEPTDANGTVPRGLMDGVSIFEHEIGHALAFEGLITWPGWGFDKTAKSRFDEHVVLTEGILYFTGPAAVACYGGPVPMSRTNRYHLGNFPNGPGLDLAQHVMSDDALTGRRRKILELELAIMKDCGLQIAPPEDWNKDGFVDDRDRKFEDALLLYSGGS